MTFYRLVLVGTTKARMTCKFIMVPDVHMLPDVPSSVGPTRLADSYTT